MAVVVVVQALSVLRQMQQQVVVTVGPVSLFGVKESLVVAKVGCQLPLLTRTTQPMALVLVQEQEEARSLVLMLPAARVTRSPTLDPEAARKVTAGRAWSCCLWRHQQVMPMRTLRRVHHRSTPTETQPQL
jgi:hypothetical protein